MFKSTTNSSTATLSPVGIVFAGGPMNRDIFGAAPWCDSNCTVLFNDWQKMNYQLNRYFNPS